VIMHFEKKEDIDNYGLLTEHKQAQELQKPCVEKVLVFDIVV
ncbi:MAG: Dabb family protein, partial [Candidatus Aenigmarchaeota archaeon]|nr:Dabb family protein [Candidatus Aenigmarchaeota archaeon]